MDAVVVTSYTLAAVGLGLIGTAIAWVFRFRINVEAANAQLIKLATARNLDRLLRLCHAAPRTYFDAVAAAVRAIPKTARDRLAIDAAILPAFDASGRELERTWQSSLSRGLVGAILGAGGVALALSQGRVPTPLWIAGGVVAAATLWLVANRAHMAAALARTRRDVLPAIAEAALSSLG